MEQQVQQISFCLQYIPLQPVVASSTHFFAVQGIAVLLTVSGWQIGNGDAILKPSWWLSQATIAGSCQFDRLLPPTWSLDVESQFYVIAPLIVVGLSALKGRDVLVAWAAFIAWGIIRLLERAYLESPHADIFLWLFAAGIAVSQFDIRPSRRMQIASCLAFITLTVTPLFFSVSRALMWRGKGISQEAVVSFFFATTIVALPFAMGTVYRKSKSWDRWLGDLSYPLYLFHWIPRDWYYSQVDWSRPYKHNAILLLLNFSAAILGAIVLLQIVDKPLQASRNSWLKMQMRKTTSNKTAVQQTGGKHDDEDV